MPPPGPMLYNNHIVAVVKHITIVLLGPYSEWQRDFLTVTDRQHTHPLNCHALPLPLPGRGPLLGGRWSANGCGATAGCCSELPSAGRRLPLRCVVVHSFCTAQHTIGTNLLPVASHTNKYKTVQRMPICTVCCWLLRPHTPHPLTVTFPPSSSNRAATARSGS